MKKILKTTAVAFMCLLLTVTQLSEVFALDKFQKQIDSFTSNIKAAIVYDVSADKLLYEKNSAQKISVASTTKLLTCLTALRYVSPDAVITVGDEIKLRQPNSSLSLIQKGHKLKLRTLIAALLLPSGNDAAYTVAVNTARIQSGNYTMSDRDAVNHFCALMNSYAKELGCKNTNFVNPEGWDNPNHYSTAEDMLLIALEAVKNVFIISTAKIDSKRFYFASGENIVWTNSNSLLHKGNAYYYEHATGLKTGTTNAAGKCLVATAEKDGRQLLILVYGAATEDDRFGRVRDIFEYVFANPAVNNVPVIGDTDESGDVTASDARTVLRASVGLEEITDILMQRGDTDGDKILTSSDARTILRIAVGLETPQPVEALQPVEAPETHTEAGEIPA